MSGLAKLRDVEAAATPAPWHFIGEELRAGPMPDRDFDDPTAEPWDAETERAHLRWLQATRPVTHGDCDQLEDGRFIVQARNTYAALLDVAEAAAAVEVHDLGEEGVAVLGLVAVNDALARLREVSP